MGLLGPSRKKRGTAKHQIKTMSILASTIHRGPLVRAQKTVIYGPEGIGKTTLAAQFPSPVFLDTEGGTHHLDVARFPAPKTWEDVTKTIAALASEPHEFKTLVVDTADWLEKLLIEEVCRRANKTSIEEFGYGKGYVILAEECTARSAILQPRSGLCIAAGAATDKVPRVVECAARSRDARPPARALPHREVRATRRGGRV